MQTKVFNIHVLDNKVIQNAYSILSGNIYLLGNGIHTIAVTSCSPKEGKTSLSTALAITMAGMGKKTILVDLDLRKRYIKSKNGQGDELYTYGISHCLNGDMELKDAICNTNIENLFFLDPGEILENPISYLCSDRFDSFIRSIDKEYDYAIFDTPALKCVTDAVIVSARAEATLLVVKTGHTTLTDIKNAQEQLDKANAKLIGTVLFKYSKRAYIRKFASYSYFSNDKKSENIFYNKRTIYKL